MINAIKSFKKIAKDLNIKDLHYEILTTRSTIDHLQDYLSILWDEKLKRHSLAAPPTDEKTVKTARERDAHLYKTKKVKKKK